MCNRLIWNDIILSVKPYVNDPGVLTQVAEFWQACGVPAYTWHSFTSVAQLWPWHTHRKKERQERASDLLIWFCISNPNMLKYVISTGWFEAWGASLPHLNICFNVVWVIIKAQECCCGTCSSNINCYWFTATVYTRPTVFKTVWDSQPSCWDTNSGMSWVGSGMFLHSDTGYCCKTPSELSKGQKSGRNMRRTFLNLSHYNKHSSHMSYQLKCGHFTLECWHLESMRNMISSGFILFTKNKR